MRSGILLILVLAFQQLVAGSFVEERQVNCGEKIEIARLGYPFWNPAEIIKRPMYGYAQLIPKEPEQRTLIYQAPPCVKIKDTVIIVCARATQITCDTGYYIMNVNCSDSSLAKFVVMKNIICNDSIIVDDMSAFQIPVILEGPKNGDAKILLYATDGAGIKYRPKKDYEGPDYVKVGLRFNGPRLYIFNVYCKELSFNEENYIDNPVIRFNTNEALIRILSEHKLGNIKILDIHGRVMPIEVKRYENVNELKYENLGYGLFFISFEIGRTHYVEKFIVAN